MYNHVSHSHTLEFSVSPDELFPLFTPVKEKLWVHDWEVNLIYAKTDTAEEQGAVFTTPHSDAVWVLSQYDPQNYAIQYVRFTPNLYVTLIEIRYIPADKVTRVQVTYTITGLSEAGNQLIEKYTPEDYQRRMKHWQDSISHYLKTGETLIIHEDY